MAKKMYFKISPENFMLYSGINRDGEIKYRKAKPLDVEDEFYNVLILEGKRKKLKGRIKVKEQSTKTKFIIKIIPNKDNTASVKIYSNKLELRTYGDIPLKSILMNNRQAAGFFCSFRAPITDNEELNERLENKANMLKERYAAEVLNFFEEAVYAGRNFKNDVRQQDKQTQKHLQCLSRKMR